MCSGFRFEASSAPYEDKIFSLNTFLYKPIIAFPLAQQDVIRRSLSNAEGFRKVYEYGIYTESCMMIYSAMLVKVLFQLRP